MCDREELFAKLYLVSWFCGVKLWRKEKANGCAWLVLPPSRREVRQSFCYSKIPQIVLKELVQFFMTETTRNTFCI